MKWTHALPLLAFAVLALALGVLLVRPTPLALIDKPAPPFDYMFPDKPVLVNFFASWCTPCRAEHAQLAALAEKHGVTVYGVAYKDKKEDVEKYLSELGNPYERIILDEMGNVFIDWGLAGVPESFIVHDDRVRYRHQGVIMEDDVTQKILPALERLKNE